ncbi:MAG: transcriptional regulator NrdR [Candidatus Wildermuthbacteria bacterium RIFCSPHIGHO2_01_FULL_48_25]|uniref:Transcriptional repressor NrdR n=2 Tax=Parcubacteria group TaxID=1794811 RepID=A0A1F8H8F5_9BACT|nr:MAG: transcriptional regulator NrdR [Candidatus Yanofskybacteria bacterium RIFCSPLOWO2_02_FULL_47_9b]OHA64103.1 MAG: transcriptional regulator NrdR [Candidatus Wildermuthbacteria bacterium RIFCSPHIGHO2_01_FULL_48_25]OHA69122.1 MAG: transcriptional regulator NrdR [Candidatus Wildermuthbacteria bacterium RIFCSPHIGHO2_02_FULL_49_12b]OHA73199.1 MAG: transcriptional regulator NrdR [Candidatus Wildermuthbacteria bacterium RIFCSPLOWO2_01_FULL_48_16]
MNCPLCQSKTRVINSRTAGEEKAIKRRRECVQCKQRFTTYERLELLGLEILKRDGSREPYLRHKIELGLRKALEKRPYTEQQFQKVVSAVEGDIFNLEKELVPSEQVGQVVLSHLKSFDKVAYLRFASVYRKFGSTKAFEREIQKLEKSK